MTEGAKDVVTGEVLKRDAHGRVHSTKEHREAVLVEFGRSGLTGPQIARAAGIPYQTFTTWRKRQAKALEAGDEVRTVVRRRVEPAAEQGSQSNRRYPYIWPQCYVWSKGLKRPKT